mgnify:CR=1 FL=1
MLYALSCGITRICYNTEAVIKTGEKIITEMPCKTVGYDYFIPENDIHLATAIVLMAIGAFIIILTEKKAAAHK